ncbi:uncharacterized protein Z518_08407 [Rhinocladiella mackenziei CBS 650.93]|uniref:DUF6536 domain-containing protein n=1 Tax=Rhinocladiella mackenziei CBS 650.93 TaxID=1442369 RepID=A0A0D2IGR5_9EURO|nr:uncharacterized protein Z518_08407 [Rhinocladiella mackenziei CBS 650.93]KIX02466.1 hypothetical protein Z518_08407 [Rhinocladiella mackenziei CBS 650.93]
MGYHQDGQVPEWISLKGTDNRGKVSLTEQLEEDHEIVESKSRLLTLGQSPSNRSGWRRGFPVAICAVVIVLVINIAFGIWALIHGHMHSGVGTLSEGQCSRISDYSLYIHLLINVLSTALLGASNYAMQCLAAPDRGEVDKAHARGDWLDIGIPSLRNLARIDKKRVKLLIVLGISSVPLHLLYNSVIFKVISANGYAVAVVTHGFESGAAFNSTRPNDLYVLPSNQNGTFSNPSFQSLPSDYPFTQLQDNVSGLDRLSNADCMDAYRNSILTNRRNLFVITANNTYNDGSLVTWTESHPYDRDRPAFDPLGWICIFLPKYNGLHFSDQPRCNVQDVIGEAGTWSIADYPVDYCLSQPVEERCQMQFSLAILIVVICCNLAKGVAMLLATRMLSDRNLMTVGDAVASFLDAEDGTTHGLCLMSRDDIPANLSHYRTSRLHRPAVYKARRRFFFHSASPARWVIFAILSTAALGATGYLLGQGIAGLKWLRLPVSLSALAKMGLGSVSADTLVRLGGSIGANNSLVGYVLLVNLPQLIVSSIYLLYNALFTTMTLSSEWSSFGTTRQTLRVSRPQCPQRSTFYLQLPYRYAIPLLVASGTLHWLISQSIFLVRVRMFDFFGDDDPEHSITTAGYSCIAIILAIALGSTLVLACALLALRPLPDTGPPPGPNCSLIISAACHPDVSERDTDSSVPLSMRELQWGATMHKGSATVGHCTFSSGPAEPPLVGNKYS